MDQTIWREKGDPLAAPTGHGALDGMGIAVKDLFALAGHAVGCGNPRYLAQAPVQARTAPAVARLLAAGAHITGIARTDEFAYSLSGVNVHYGTPPNPKAPGRISGGSSSGPAAAVATGAADIGLGTDTAGSLRVPAAYEGLWGIRTTGGRVPTDGVHPLSPSFDTVGVLAANPRTFLAALDALMPEKDSARIGEEGAAWDAPALDALVEPDVAQAVAGFRERMARAAGKPGGEAAGKPGGEAAGADGGITGAGHAAITAADLDEWNALFAVVRGYEAWQADGAWVSRNWDALDPLIAARFDRDSHITAADYARGRDALAASRADLRRRFAKDGGRVLLIPTASSVAPLRDDAEAGTASGTAAAGDATGAAAGGATGAAAVARARADTMRLTALAGVGGLPAVNIPIATAAGLPCGVCLVGPAGSDKALARLAVACAALAGAPSLN